MIRIGVDEAGKGPVLGSMFIAAVSITDDRELPDGITDSKRLSPTRRSEFAESIESSSSVDVAVVEVTPNRIDSNAGEINQLVASAHARAIDDLLDSSQLPNTTQSVLCDACDVDADRFARRVRRNCSRDIPIDARHSADEVNEIVGAASVIAKVSRDRHIDEFASEYGDIGSGYPSDQNTRTFLERYVREHDTLPPFTRKSWSTATDIVRSVSQRNLDDFRQ